MKYFSTTFAALLAMMVSASVVSSFAVAQSQAVAVSEDDAFYTLDNGTIQAMVSKRSGDLVSMKFRGTEVFATFLKEDGTPDLDRDPPGFPGRGSRAFGADHMYGFWSHDTTSDHVETKITIDPKSNGGERAEVSVKGFSDGKKMGRGPGSPNGDFEADVEIRYTLGRGDSGIYTYCIFDHKPQYPNATMGEARFCAKLNSDFDWMLIDKRHNLYYPPEPESQGWDDKYNYTAVQWENPAFGFASVQKNVGFFIVNASVEYLTGPPTKVEFLCHRDTNLIAAPCVLNYWRSSHYGGGGVDAAQGEAWTKVIGPFLLYCNRGNNPQTIWADANAQQRRESEKWPYDWVSGVDYPHKNQRSTVSGQLVLTDPLAPGGASMSNVRVGLAHPDYMVTTGRPSAINAPNAIHWQVDSKHYEFWVRGDNSGAFSIPNVRSGVYTLHAIADGVLGEFAATNITVEAGKSLDLGKLTWTPVRRGKQLWDVGIANRSGSEFAGGQDYFHAGMGMAYALRFPDDVNYVIGKSDFAKDWFYLHVPHADDAAIAAALNAGPRPARGGAFSAAGTLTTRRGGPASQIAGGAPASQPATRGAGRGIGTLGARGIIGPIGGGGSRPTPYSITFDLPTAPRGKATLRVAIATSNVPSQQIAISVNDQPAGRVDRLANDSAIGRNGIQGIWYERELAFDASMMKQGTNVLRLIVPPGGLTAGVIYDYVRLELDESAQ